VVWLFEPAIAHARRIGATDQRHPIQAPTRLIP
jgi:hypothetical protein